MPLTTKSQSLQYRNKIAESMPSSSIVLPIFNQYCLLESFYFYSAASIPCRIVLSESYFNISL